MTKATKKKASAKKKPAKKAAPKKTAVVVKKKKAAAATKKKAAAPKNAAPKKKAAAKAATKKATPTPAAKKKLTDQRSRKLRGAQPITVDHPTVEQVKKIHPEKRIVEAGIDSATLFDAIDHAGHLTVDGRHFVTGDVRITGALRIFEMSALFVAGDVYAQSMFAEGDFCCRNLILEDTLYGSYESGMTAAQNASGKVWLYGEHDFELGKVSFKAKLRLGDYSKGAYQENPKPLPKNHGLSKEAIDLVVTRPTAYYEGKDERGVSGEDWWKLLQDGGVSV